MKLVLAVALASAALVAQPAPSSLESPAVPAFDLAAAKQAVAALATILEQDFVVPEAGYAYARMLRGKLASGAYDRHATAEAFSAAVSADIQATYPDGHLALRPPGFDPGRPAAEPRTGVQRAEWIAPGIAYLSFSNFPGDPATLDRLAKFVAAHGEAKTLIIDARVMRGGGMAEMNTIFPYLYVEPTALVQMDARIAVEEAGRGVPDNPTLHRVPGPEGVVRREHVITPASPGNGLARAKVILLTSAKTRSAAEHMALALKRTGRATLIGEVTAGAGNFGGYRELGGGYRAFVPVGRTFDPATGEGWEGTGVKPDIEVRAERALYEALVRSGIAPPDAERLSKVYRPEGSMERQNPLRG